jgi:hypothetical protein
MCHKWRCHARKFHDGSYYTATVIEIDEVNYCEIEGYSKGDKITNLVLIALPTNRLLSIKHNHELMNKFQGDVGVVFRCTPY